MDFFTTSDKVKIYYEMSGQGRPVVFIHGFSEDHKSFKIQQRVLSKDYKIISYDLRGHGNSDRVDYGLNLKRFALDLKELIDIGAISRINQKEFVILDRDLLEWV